MTWPRRQFLQALGFSSGFLPSLVKADVSQSNNGRRPLQRFLVYFITQGTHYPNWHMDPDGRGTDETWSSTIAGVPNSAFSPCLEPLYPVRDQLLLLDGIGLGMTAAFGEEAHHTGHAVALSGARPRLEGKYVVETHGPSIDTTIAEALAPRSPIASLHYGSSFRPISHDAFGRPVPQQLDPRAAFARLFPGLGQGAGQLDARRSVLDFTAGISQMWRNRLSGVDRMKLAHHHQLIRELELQLAQVAELDCQGVVAPGDPPQDPRLHFDWYAEAWAQLALTALRCGLSSVVAISDEGPDCDYLGVPSCDIHSDHAHSAGLLETSNEVMTLFYRYYAHRMRLLIEGLAAFPEGEGTMLDSTLVLMANELGSPNHDWAQYPMVLAGGRNYFGELGRYIHWPRVHELDGPFGPDRMGPAHNRVLVSILRAFGIEREQVGEGELTRLDGSSLSLRGALPELNSP